MHSSRTVASLLVVGLVASLSSAAFAEPPHAAPEPAKVETPTPTRVTAPKPMIRPTAPTTVAAPVVAPASIHQAAPVAITLPAAAKASARPTTTTTSARRSSTSEAPAAPKMALEPQSSDPGISIKADPKNGNRILVKGVAEGPAVKYLDGNYYENGKRIRPVDYEVARGVSFQIDHESMPDFSKDPDYTNKNKWYFSHLADTGTQRGETAVAVAQHLAASLNKGGAYRATVSETEDGAAISLEAL